MVAPSILMAAICQHLSEDEDLQNQLRNDESLPLRPLRNSSACILHIEARTAIHAVTISGQDVPAEEPITLTDAAANRDPDQFANPEEFVLNRDNITTHLGFGRGKYRCAGMSLARMTMKIFLSTLLRNTTAFDFDGELEFANLPEIGMISCPLKF